MNRFSSLKSPQLLAIVISLIAVLCLGSNLASAQSPPSAGYDLLTTASGTSINLSSIGLGSSIPLQGVPIEASLGSTDTIMNRPDNVVYGTAQSLNVTALFMMSTSPVEYDGQSADIYVTLNNSGGLISTSVLPQPDTLNASGGTITVSSGGTFTANFVVNADVIFVPHGASVTNSANYLGHQAAPQVTLSPATSTWSTTAPSGYPSSSTFPSGGFYPILPAHNNGPHPVTPATCGGSSQVKSNGENIQKVNCIAVPLAPQQEKEK
jgi:hypothetical protein